MLPIALFSLPIDLCLADIQLENEALTLALRSNQIERDVS
jgi:hypothetical protein